MTPIKYVALLNSKSHLVHFSVSLSYSTMLESFLPPTKANEFPRTSDRPKTFSDEYSCKVTFYFWAKYLRYSRYFSLHRKIITTTQPSTPPPATSANGTYACAEYSLSAEYPSAFSCRIFVFVRNRNIRFRSITTQDHCGRVAQDLKLLEPMHSSGGSSPRNWSSREPRALCPFYKSSREPRLEPRVNEPLNFEKGLVTASPHFYKQNWLVKLKLFDIFCTYSWKI
jgi:hypothetical protein